MCPGPDPCVLRRGDCLCCTRPESKTCPESERHLQECEGLFARLRIVGEEEAPGGCHRKTIRRRPSPQQPQNRRLLGTPKHGPHDGLFGLGKERLHPNKRKTGVCWEPRNRRCHRLGDDFVGCLLPPRWGPTTLSQTRETLRSKAQPIAAAVTSARHRLAWGRNLGRLRCQAVDEHYSRHLVDVKSRIPHIVILPPIART